MKIRLAEQEDYQELMNLYNLFVGEDRYSQHDNDSFNRVLESDNEFIFVAEEQNKLIGFATSSIRNVVRYPKPIAELDELFVHPEYRKHGMGRKLMEIIEEKAKEQNCYLMYIESHYDHKAAHHFYESLGYKNYGYHFVKTL